MPSCARTSPAGRHRRQSCAGAGGQAASARQGARHRARRKESAALDRPHRRCAPSRATAGSTSSCRRRERSRTTSSSSPRSRRPRTTLDLPVILEGYEPPRDPRLTQLPRHARPRRDRGQHPSGARAGTSSSSSTTHLYEEARQSRLATEKFMIDGRHTGTGGGNHFVLGGATPADSPFLRRPDLLRSLVALLAQPSVAVATCSPACSSARPARRRASTRRATIRSTRLEIAFRQIAAGRRADARPGWSTALFRNLLIDVTGNTHRAEFCIDKLYSPDGPTGRLGLLEMRAFEMPPHARMSLDPATAAARAGRALLAGAVRAAAPGALGHRAARPLHAAALRLSRISRDVHRRAAAGRLSRFDAGWFAPHFEFRFPQLRRLRRQAASTSSCARRSSRGTCWARRARPAAPCATSTPRSSALQVKVTGLVADRYVADLQRPRGAAAAHRHGRRVRRRRALPRLAAAVVPASDHRRARAADLRPRRHLDAAARWAAASTTSRIRAGAATTSFPVNAYEAESRRLARFFRIGHTPGRMQARAPEASAELPVHARPAPFLSGNAG